MKGWKVTEQTFKGQPARVSEQLTVECEEESGLRKDLDVLGLSGSENARELHLGASELNWAK